MQYCLSRQAKTSHRLDELRIHLFETSVNKLVRFESYFNKLKLIKVKFIYEDGEEKQKEINVQADLEQDVLSS